LFDFVYWNLGEERKFVGALLGEPSPPARRIESVMAYMSPITEIEWVGGKRGKRDLPC
jgi:hypothetical protein